MAVSGPRRRYSDQSRVDVAVLDHHGVIEHGHVGHAAVAVAGVEIGAEHRILLGSGRRCADVADDVGIAFGDAAHVARRRKIRNHHPHRDAGAAGLAGRPVGDRLAAAEAAVGQQIVEFGSALANQMGKYLALLLALQIGAGRGRGQIKLRRIARVLGHVVRPLLLPIHSIARRLRHVKALYRAGALRMAARAGLLITTVPSMMSCSSRRRSLKKATNSTNGVKNETVNQNAMACTAPRMK